uniref:Uncharacterized protein n=1 Tax=Arundo donax TaxID=35708 RepID=A0A0A8Z8R0_ARUDO
MVPGVLDFFKPCLLFFVLCDWSPQVLFVRFLALDLGCVVFSRGDALAFGHLVWSRRSGATDGSGIEVHRVIADG